MGECAFGDLFHVLKTGDGDGEVNFILGLLGNRENAMSCLIRNTCLDVRALYIVIRICSKNKNQEGAGANLLLLLLLFLFFGLRLLFFLLILLGRLRIT